MSNLQFFTIAGLGFGLGWFAKGIVQLEVMLWRDRRRTAREIKAMKDRARAWKDIS